MTRRAASPHWVAVRNSFFDQALPAIRGPGRAMFPHPTSSLTSHTISTPILRSSPLSKPTNTRGDWKSPEQLTPTTYLFSSTQFESAPSASTYTNTSSRKGCLVPRELGVPDQRSLGAIHHQRVSDTPRVFARAAQVHHHSQQGTTISSAGGSVQTEGERGSSPSAAVRSLHNQSDLCRPQKRRRLETDYRPEIPELPYSTASLQDGGPVHAAKHHQSGMVHGEIGPKGCVLNHPCGPRILEPSNLPSRSTTQLDAVPVPPIRALYRTLHLFKSYKACNPVPTSVRHTPNYLSRRFVTGSSYQRSTIGGPFNSHMVASSLGFLINIPKSITAPTCHLEFLGLIVDTDNMVISLPAHKLHCIQKEASHLLSLDRIPMRTLACFIGTLVATKPAVWTGPLHYRALQDMKIRSLRQHPHYQGSVSLSKEARVDLQWWCSELPSHCSAPIWKPEASTVIESDASKLGWGAVCQGVPTGGRWTLEETKFHINYLELKAMFLALQSYLKDKTDIVVLVKSDNRTAIAYLNKLGSPLRSQLCQLVLEIWEWCLLHRITPHAEYLAGKDNVLADWESRHHDSSDWQLLPSVFDAVHLLLGPFTIDLFASRTNAQLPDYCSWRPDPQARVVDAFSTSWSQDQPYLFPPFNLIGRALSKICLEEVDYACLIAPTWPAQVWYSQVLRMLVRNPILLPMEQDLLLSPDLKPHPLIQENRMSLAAWPVSGKLSQHKDFLKELQNCSCTPGDLTPMQHTIQPGLSGVAGVLEGTLIHFQHL